jgi:hypothetical protein
MVSFAIFVHRGLYFTNIVVIILGKKLVGSSRMVSFAVFVHNIMSVPRGLYFINIVVIILLAPIWLASVAGIRYGPHLVGIRCGNPILGISQGFGLGVPFGLLGNNCGNKCWEMLLGN